MSRSAEVIGTLVGLVAVALAVVVFHFSRLPLQPTRPAMARVMAIAAWEGRMYAFNDHVVVRNAHATGQFSLRESELKCRVGDVVPVEQQGETLTPLARTCR